MSRKVTSTEFQRCIDAAYRPRKLTLSRARQMRHQRFVLKKKQRELALEFNVSQGIVSRVCSEQLWPEIE